MRSELSRRLLLGLLGCFIIGLIASRVPLALLGLAIPWWLYPKPGQRMAVAACLVAGLLLSPVPAPLIQQPAPVNTVAIVAGTPTLYEDAETFDAVIQGFRYRVTVAGRPFLPIGTEVNVEGTIKPPPQGAESMFATSGISGRIRAQRLTVVAEAPAVMIAAERWRRSFVEFAEANLPPKEAALLAAICFNTQSLVDDDTMEAMRRTGTVHIVSVSGMHVIILAASLMGVLSLMPISRALQLAVLVFALGFYGLATGLNPPVVRAILMALLGYSAYRFGREPDVLTALAAAAFLYLLWRPESIWNLGFQLSFITVAAFALFLPRQADVANGVVQQMWARFRAVAGASLVALIATAPLIGYAFGQISVISIVSNLMIAAAITPILVLSMAAHLVSWGWPVATFVHGWLGWVQMSLDWTSAVPPLTLPEFSPVLLLPFYGFLILTWRLRVRRP